MIINRVVGLFLLVIFIGVPSASYAKSSLAIGQRVYEKMQEAQVSIEAKKYSDAFAALDAILAQKRLNEYEKAQTISMYGNIYYQMEKYPEAYKEFQKLIDFNDIPDGFKLVTLRTLSQLAFMQDDFDNALIYANKTLKVTDKPDPAVHILIAQIYYRKEEFPKALESTQIAIDAKKALGETVPETWLLILNAIYYSTNSFEKMVAVLKELVEFYPKESYVLNLAAIYGQLDKTKEQLLLMEPLWDQDKLNTEQQLVNLAHLLMLYKVPFKASLVLEKGLREGKIKRTEKNVELLAQSWQLAAEDDLSIKYLAEAAKLSNSGVAYLRLGQSLMNLYRLDEAETALVQALKLGGLTQEGNTYLLLGMVRYYQKQFREARKTFKEAGKYPETEKLAEQWIAFVDREKEKYESAQ